MKRQFVYELKRILLPLIVFTAMAAIVFVVAALSSDFISSYSGQAINPLTPVPASILGVLCYIVPILQFSYRMKTRSTDLWYSLPVKRGALLLQRLLAGLLLVFVPYAVSFAAGVAVIAFRDNLFAMGYYAGYFAALIPAGLALFGINCFLFTRASSIIDGIIFELGSMALLLMPFWWLDTLIPYYAPDALKGLQYHFLLNISHSGRLERNRQWARYINAVKPFYDLVLVYAGRGHLNETYSNDLQPMVENADYVNILLYPIEITPRRSTDAAVQASVQKDPTPAPAAGGSSFYSTPLAAQVYQEWKDQTQPLWVWEENKRLRPKSMGSSHKKGTLSIFLPRTFQN